MAKPLKSRDRVRVRVGRVRVRAVYKRTLKHTFLDLINQNQTNHAFFVGQHRELDKTCEEIREQAWREIRTVCIGARGVVPARAGCALVDVDVTRFIPVYCLCPSRHAFTTEIIHIYICQKQNTILLNIIICIASKYKQLIKGRARGVHWFKKYHS